jgi:hypothetical protein
MDRQAVATFPATADSVARARRFVRTTAAMWRLRPDTVADTELWPRRRIAPARSRGGYDGQS